MRVIIALFVILFFLVLGCTAKKGDEPSKYPTQPDSMDIKLVNNQPMVAPSQNIQAYVAYKKGTKLLDEYKLDEAEKYLKKAIQLDPLFVDAMDHLGLVYRRQNRLDDAKEIYLKSITINDKNLVSYQNLAIVYRLQNKLDEAFELYIKMIRIDENNPEPYYGIGELFFITADYEKALAFFDKALELYVDQNSPLVYDVFCYKYSIYYKTKNYDEALKYLEVIKKNDPNDTIIETLIKEIKAIKYNKNKN
ncbi:MAG: tetratricopeptide repeat protein [Planctomycetaceae bacterium]|jgi:tetratricopeptide (TPR) repeat protein|nr:tetratricopeptide repeat protein [Planctomycetaceae bacterium]